MFCKKKASCLYCPFVWTYKDLSKFEDVNQILLSKSLTDTFLMKLGIDIIKICPIVQKQLMAFFFLLFVELLKMIVQWIRMPYNKQLRLLQFTFFGLWYSLAIGFKEVHVWFFEFQSFILGIEVNWFWETDIVVIRNYLAIMEVLPFWKSIMFYIPTSTVESSQKSPVWKK